MTTASAAGRGAAARRRGPRLSLLADAAVLVDCPDNSTAAWLADRLEGWRSTTRAGGGNGDAADPDGIEPGGIEPGGIEPGGIEPGSIEPGGIEPGGIEEVVPTLTSVTVVVDPDRADVRAVARAIRRVLAASQGRAAGDGPAGDAGTDQPATLEIPVWFDGPDLPWVAEHAGIDEAAVVASLVGATLTVGFLGFSPGFAYLVGLPPVLAAVPRRDRPRPRVEPGAVAVAGGFAAVYPQASPGGWRLLGSTDLVLFDPATAPYARLRRGQRVRFVAAGGSDRRRPAGSAARPPLTSDAPRAVEVVSPGLATTVQDGGRRGLAHLGVPRAGPADAWAHRLANRLVGNPDGAPALEVTVSGPTLRLRSDTFVAVIGDLPVTVDGHPVPVGAPVPVAAGQHLQLGTCRSGARAVVAVAGGLLAPVVAGGRASDSLCGLGPGSLAAGDVVALGDPGRPAGRLAVGALAPGPLAGWAAAVGLAGPAGPSATAAAPAGPGAAGAGAVPAPVVVRLVAGPDATAASTARLTGGVWTVDADSNRVGVRLVPLVPRPGDAGHPGAGLRAVPPSGSGRSRGVPTGVVQLPPNGEPVVLLCDHATVGGYPVVATVASVDVPSVAQLQPGRQVRFAVEPVGAAVAARRAAAAALDRAVVAAYPTAAG